MPIEIVDAGEATTLLGATSFAGEWRSLWDRCPWATPFQGPDFAATWYAIYREQFTPLLVASRGGDGRLDGLLPLARTRDGGRLFAAGAHQAEYQGWVCGPDSADAFAPEALAVLRGTFPGRGLTLRYLPPGTPVGWLRSSPLRRVCDLSIHPRPIMRLGADRRIEERLRKSGNRNRLNHLKRTGPLDFARVTDVAELQAVLDEMIPWHDLRQAAAYGVVPFGGDPLKRPFHVALMARPGLLHVTVHRAGSRLVSAQIHVRGRAEVHSGILAHHPEFARDSPGKLHTLLLAQMLAREGCERLDLTAGGDVYKEVWAGERDEVATFRMAPSAPARWASWAHGRVVTKAKRTLRSVGVSEKGVRSFGNLARRLHPRRTPALVLDVARAWLGRCRETRIYAAHPPGIPAQGDAALVRCDAPGDLLRHIASDRWPRRREFLSAAWSRAERGHRVYTCAEAGRLLLVAWLAGPQSRLEVDEAGPGFELPPGCACVYDVMVVPEARGRGLEHQLFRAALRAAAEAGMPRLYVSCSADDTQSLRILDELGFRCQGSLWERTRLGSTRRWGSVPARGDGLESTGLSPSAGSTAPHPACEAFHPGRRNSPDSSQPGMNAGHTSTASPSGRYEYGSQP